MARRILLVSLGSIGRRHLRNTQALLPEAELCIWRHRPGDTPPEAEGIPVVYSQAEALAFAPDAVMVSSPASFHAVQSAPFAAKGVPIFVEKPLEASADALAPLETALPNWSTALWLKNTSGKKKPACWPRLTETTTSSTAMNTR